MTPLEIAMLIAGSPTMPSRDPKTGLYLVGDQPLTLAQYESGARILQLREKAAIASTSH